MTTLQASRFIGLLLFTIAATSVSAAQEPRPQEIPPPIGPHINLKPTDFAQTPSLHGKIVMTHDFYWYDSATNAHILDGDGSDALTTHPTTLKDFSYKSIAWHRKQLQDMIEAGIDVVLPVYWGAPSERADGAQMHWSFTGLPPLMKAAEGLLRDGRHPPAIGLFYDTSTLANNSWGVHVDLTTDFGKHWFYASIRDFFSMIPPRLWALIDGHPVIVLYSASFAKAHDQSCLDYVKAEFSREFGGLVPYIIREASWKVSSDNVYAWGGAVRPNFLGVGEIGPGYDHSAVPGREPLIVPREAGAFYERAWRQALRRSPSIVILETWNEFHEGTNIAESREHGRQYIDLTRKYVRLFKRGAQPPPAHGLYQEAVSVTVALGETNHERGIKQVEHEDGHTVSAFLDGKACRQMRRGPHEEQYIYFQIDDSFKWTRTMDATVVVDYFDGDQGSFTVQYDSHDLTATLNGAYKDCAERISLQGSHSWKTASFHLTGACFEGAQNAGADFRIAMSGANLAVRQVLVTRKDTP